MNRLYEKFVAIQSLEPQSRGKEFEKLIGLMLSNENIRHSLSYRPKGEEIDGALIWHAQTFLIEAKWHRDPIPASAIYAFRGKMEGKFSGTRGIFISMSGYAEDCQEVVSTGKALNVLLFDQRDIEDIVGSQNTGGVEFTKVLAEKLFAASRIGNIYLTWRDLLQSRKTENKSLLIYCCSPDEIVLNSLIKHLSDYDHLMTDQLVLSPMQGSLQGNSILSLIQLSLANASDQGAILLIISADQIDDESKRILSNVEAQFPLPDSWKYHLVIASPNIFSWVGEIGIPREQEIAIFNGDKVNLNLSSLALLKRAFDASKIIDWNVLASKNEEVKETLSLIRGILPRRPGHV
jgi:hypothetical protein